MTPAPISPMLEIVRGRTWLQVDTVVDNDSGTPSDLSGHTLKSQIREKTATKVNGVFTHTLVVETTVALQPATDNVVRRSLTRTQTEGLSPGEYLVDLVATKNGLDESLINPEPIRVVNRPTQL